ncbi:MAG: cytochrome c [Parafilimonas sp.]
MNNEVKYIFKGVLYACLLFAGIWISYYVIYSKKETAVKKQQPIISYDDLMNTREISEGKVLFDKNCSACHKLLAKDGSNFQDIVNGNYDKKDLFGWIRNSDSVIRSGNKYYTAVFNENNKVQMRSFPNLSDEEIGDIIDYIKVEKAFANLHQH